MKFQIWSRHFEIHSAADGELSIIACVVTPDGIKGIGEIDVNGGLLWFVEHPSRLFKMLRPGIIVSLGADETNDVSVLVINCKDGQVLNRLTIPITLGAVYYPTSGGDFLYLEKSQNQFLKINVASGFIEDTTNL